jgi:hypothetical protein
MATLAPGHAVVPPAGRVVSIAVSLITITVIGNFISTFNHTYEIGHY